MKETRYDVSWFLADQTPYPMVPSEVIHAACDIAQRFVKTTRLDDVLIPEDLRKDIETVEKFMFLNGLTVLNFNRFGFKIDADKHLWLKM